jgi:hypothetical protein
MIVIATEKMFINAKKIHSIFLDEEADYEIVKKNKKTLFYYTLRINFTPTNEESLNHANNSSRYENIMCVDFKIYGHKRAVKLYKDIVSQIREQCPDQLYLDKIADTFLSRSIDDDPSTEELYPVRKEKGRSEGVFRSTKASSRRGSERKRR